MIGARRVHVNPAPLGDGKKLVELGQPLFRQRVGLHEEGAVGKEHADAVDAQGLHPLKILLRGLRVELLPHLRRPARARPIVGHSPGHEGFPTFADEAPPIGGDADFRQWHLFSRRRHAEI